MEHIRKILANKWTLLAVVVGGLAARLGAATLGHNFDMDSWSLVAEIMRKGGNVYAETERYNYGPVWSFILQGLDLLAGHRPELLRYLVAGFLSLVDLGIFLVLCRWAGPMAGVLFFLNPISILVSGYGCQFDNLAILLGLWSVYLLGDDFGRPLNRRKFAGLLVLGVSLATKHLLFVFPVWLAVKQVGRGPKAAVLLLPVLVFLLCFVPYWPAASQGIIEHVFAYGSFKTNYFYEFFVPQCVHYCFNSTSLWCLLLVLFAFLNRARNGFESLLVYTGILVAFSPACANQYLAIPVALAAVFPNWLFLLYTLIGTYHLAVQIPNGPLIRLFGYYDNVAIYTLFGALVWMWWRSRLLQMFHEAGRAIEFQLRGNHGGTPPDRTI